MKKTHKTWLAFTGGLLIGFLIFPIIGETVRQTIFPPPPPKEIPEQAFNHMNSLSSALQIYLADHDNTYPPATTQEEFRRALNTHAKTQLPFIDPAHPTFDPQFNLQLAGTKAPQFSPESLQIQLYSPAPRGSDTWIISYLGGSTTLVSGQRLSAAKASLQANQK